MKSSGITTSRRVDLANQLESEAMEVFNSDGHSRAGLMLLASRVISEMNNELLAGWAAAVMTRVADLVDEPQEIRVEAGHDHVWMDGRCACGRFEQGVKDDIERTAKKKHRHRFKNGAPCKCGAANPDVQKVLLGQS